MKKPLDLSVVANNRRYVTINVKKPDGTAENITGWGIKWQFFAKGSSTAKATKKTSDGTIVITNGAAGQFAFWIEPDDTADEEGEFIHEAVTVDGDNNPVTLTNNDPLLTAGKLTIRKQYTVQD